MRKAFLALLLAAGVTPALAQEKNFDLKISHWVPASHPLQKSLEDWAAAVENPNDEGDVAPPEVVPAKKKQFRPEAKKAPTCDTSGAAPVKKKRLFSQDRAETKKVSKDSSGSGPALTNSTGLPPT